MLDNILYKCSICGEEKEATEYHKNSSMSSGLDTRCKDCKRDYNKKWREENKDHEREVKKKYRKEHKEEISERNKNYNKEHKEEQKIYGKEYRRKNKDKIKEKDQKYYQENSEEICEKCSDYRKNNKEVVNANCRRRRRENPIYKISEACRSRMWFFFRDGKPGHTIEFLGCSWEIAKFFLENQFFPNPRTGEMMSWENYGIREEGKEGWHIDHIIPLSSFDLAELEQCKKAFHITNLQPLWGKDNLSKGSKLNWREVSNGFSS